MWSMSSRRRLRHSLGLRSSIFLRIFAAAVFLGLVWGDGGLAESGETALPAPGMQVYPSEPYHPLLLKGVLVDPKHPLRLDFIFDRGDSSATGDALKEDMLRQVRFFLTALTLPEEDLWVNLAPQEEDRIIPELLARTEMGRALLEEDYILKQLTASMLDPEAPAGGAFWQEVYAKAGRLYGTSRIPIDSMSRVWIVPNRADVYSTPRGAYVSAAHLTVLQEEDYRAWRRRRDAGALEIGEEGSASLTGPVLRRTVLPIVEKDVNTGQRFASLRKVYHAVILAAWFKQALRGGFWGRTYIGRGKVAGVDVADPEVRREIYDRYLQALRVGVVKMLRLEKDPQTGRQVPRKYFTGGVTFLRPPVRDLGRPPDSLKTGGRGALRLTVALENVKTSSPLPLLVSEDDFGDLRELPWFSRLFPRITFESQSRFLKKEFSIDAREQALMVQSLLGPVEHEGKVVPRLVREIGSLFHDDVDLRDISRIVVQVFSDEGLNKRVFLVEVDGRFRKLRDVDMIPIPRRFLPLPIEERLRRRLRDEIYEVEEAMAGRRRPFLVKVFRPDDVRPDPVDSQILDWAREMGKRLQLYGRYPHVGDDVFVRNPSHGKGWVAFQGLIPGLSLSERWDDLKKRLEEGAIEEDDYRSRVNNLTRAAVKGFVKMWKILDGRYITDPKPQNIIVEGSFEEGYHSVFFDLDKLLLRPEPLLELLKKLQPYFGDVDEGRPFMDGVRDALSAWYSPDEVRKMLHDLLEEISPSYPHIQYPRLERILRSYLGRSFDDYIPAPSLETFLKKMEEGGEQASSSVVETPPGGIDFAGDLPLRLYGVLGMDVSMETASEIQGLRPLVLRLERIEDPAVVFSKPDSDSRESP